MDAGPLQNIIHIHSHTLIHTKGQFSIANPITGWKATREPRRNPDTQLHTKPNSRLTQGPWNCEPATLYVQSVLHTHKKNKSKTVQLHNTLFITNV